MSTTIRVLILEDRAADAELMLHELRQAEFDPDWQRVEAEPDYLAALETNPDLILADWSLPHFSGLRGLQLMNERGLDIPFVIVTGSIGEEAAVEAMRQGAVDYLLKDRLARLGQAVGRALEGKHLRDERKRAEDALQQSEERFRTLIENTSDLVIVLKPDGTSKYISPSVKRLLGYKPDEIVGQSITDFVHPDDLPAALQAIAIRVRTPGLADSASEFRVRHKDGSYRMMEVIGNNLLENPAVNGIVINARDITERKRAEEALRESEEKYRTILENIEEGYFEVDIAGNFTFFNESVCRLLGYSREEMMGMNNRYYTDETNAQKLYRTFNEVYRTGVPAQEYDWEVIRKDGTKRYVESSVSIRKNKSGQPIGFRGIVRDITERKQAVEELRKSEERFKLIFEYAPDAIYLNDLKGNFIAGNKAAEKITGFEKDELIGGSFLKLNLLSVDQLPKAVTLLAKNARGKPTGPDEFILKRKAGDKVLVEITTHPIKFEKRTVVLGIARDITERKRAEEVLRESERELKEAQLLGRVGNWEFDVESQKITWSDQVYRLYERDPVLGPPTVEEEAAYYSTEQAQILHEYARRAVEEAQEFKYDLEATLPSGKRVYFSARMQPIKDAHGRVVKLFGTVQDITDRKRAEEELREREAKLSAIYRAAPVGIGVDVNRVIKGVNDTLCHIMGYSREELIGQNSRFLFLTQEDYESVGRDKNRLMAEHRSEFVETRCKRKDGRIIEVLLSAVPLDAADLSQGVIFTVLDITERKQVEAALAKERSLLSALTGNIPDAIYFKDVESRFLLINQAQARRFGLNDPDQAVGKMDFDFFAEEHARPTYENERAIMQSGQPVVGMEEKETWPDGRVGWVSTTKMPLRDEKGNIVGTFGISRDITERKQAEERIEAALEEKEALLREVHHRVKNNLQAMISLMEMHSSQIQDDGTRQFLRELEEQTRTMSLVYEQLYQSENLARVSMAPYFQKLASNVLEVFGGGRDIQLNLDIAPLSLDVAQAMPCGLIVNELLTNSLKYAFPPKYKGKPAILIALKQAKKTYKLTVSDNGVGLPPEMNMRTSGSLRPGSGKTLGLRLVDLWAVHQLGGKLEVVGKPGTVYSVSFAVE